MARTVPANATEAEVDALVAALNVADGIQYRYYRDSITYRTPTLGEKKSSLNYAYKQAALKEELAKILADTPKEPPSLEEIKEFLLHRNILKDALTYTGSNLCECCGTRYERDGSPHRLYTNIRWEATTGVPQLFDDYTHLILLQDKTGSLAIHYRYGSPVTAMCNSWGDLVYPDASDVDCSLVDYRKREYGETDEFEEEEEVE